MKQKIVIRVPLDCDKCRSKAFKIAADAHGVSSVALEGEHKDKVAVIGESVDSVCLGRALRKKFRHAIIESVEEVKEKKEEKKDEKLLWYPYPPCPPPISYACDEYGQSVCIVM
ncbi:hypothetical protein VNO80_05250 [Phaseolus coccineus]|uniref:HMA domain-containing protein n=1 Tax=Phaseolus coccineus TaxID=3886 RepID=A0AAN9RHP8_PHACN